MIQDALSTPPRWLIRLIWLAVALMILRNLLPPNAFTATVLVFDYEFGLVRRGLIGEIGGLYWGETVSKSEVFTASAVLTLLGIAALLAALWRQLKTNLLTALLFFLWVTSFAFASLIGATGYLDSALILYVAFALFFNPTSPIGLLARALAVILGLMSHEVMLPYFCIFFVFELWLTNAARPFATRAALAATPLIVGLITFLGLTVVGQLSPDQAQAYIAHIEAKTEFTAEPEATVVMERTLGDNLAMMAEKRTMLDYKSWVVFDGLPLAALSLWIGWLCLRLLGPAGGVTRVLLIGAILAPLSLNIIAFDVVRFGAISALVGFLCAATILTRRPEATNRLQALLTWPMVLVVLTLNLFVGVNQMNTGDGHEFAVPWVLIKHVTWFQ